MGGEPNAETHEVRFSGNKKGRGLLTQANFLVPLATLLLKILELILRIMKVI